MSFQIAGGIPIKFEVNFEYGIKRRALSFPRVISLSANQKKNSANSVPKTKMSFGEHSKFESKRLDYID